MPLYLKSCLQTRTPLVRSHMRTHCFQIGNSVTSDLESQGTQLLDSHDKVKGMKALVERARATLRRMGRRDLEQKATLVSIIALLFVAIALVTYFRFIQPIQGPSGH